MKASTIFTERLRNKCLEQFRAFQKCKILRRHIPSQADLAEEVGKYDCREKVFTSPLQSMCSFIIVVVVV